MNDYTRKLITEEDRLREQSLAELAVNLGRPLSYDETAIARAAYNRGRLQQLAERVALVKMFLERKSHG